MSMQNSHLMRIGIKDEEVEKILLDSKDRTIKLFKEEGLLVTELGIARRQATDVCNELRFNKALENDNL